MAFRPETWPRVREIFEQAIALPAGERATYIASACGADDKLRAAVLRLVESHERGADLLATEALSPSVVRSATSFEGHRLGPYQLEGRLGAGGMGEVYRARDTRLDRTVAIKVLPPHVSRDRQARDRFEREARAVAALNHPNICTLHDIGEAPDPAGASADPIRFLVMELVEGTTLDFADELPLAPARVAEIAAQVCDGLEAAHARGIVHRDLKPLNLMLTPRGQIKVLDFGVARLDQPAADQGADASAIQTATGLIVGTLAYMSPEQLSGERVTAASDIFSLGLVLYRLLTGRHPFAAAEEPHAQMRALLHALLVHTPRPPHDYQASVPPALEALVLRMLEKDPAARPPAREISRVLRAPTTLGSSTERPGSHGAQHHNLAATRERSPHDQTYESLAVLPFVNAAGDEDTESLCEGIAETLINHFSHAATLRVVARSTAFRYKGNEDAQKVARELGVSAILSGRLVKRGDTLRIQAELIDPLTNTQLWGQKYDRQLRDLFAVEEEIARRIASALQLKLVPRTGEHLARRYTDNLEAYQLCLKGRFFWSKRTRDALERAIECYRGAIELEPSYALAYSGLADCYHVLGSFLMLPPGDAFPRARGAARRALEIDADLVAARVTQASVSASYDRDYTASDRQFLEAIGANPDYPEARQWYGLNLCMRGRFDEGLGQLQRAQQLDALSPMLNAQLASGYYLARRYAEAEEVLKKTLEIEGSFGPAHWFLGKVKSQQGDAGGAVAELQAAVDSTGRGSVFLATLGWALGTFGRSEEAGPVLHELRTRSQHEYVSSICFAYIHVGLGDNVAAMARLREALAERSFFAPWIAVDPMFDPVRGDPGFDALVDALKRPAV